ncbi:MAG: valine--tRNA ligase [Patescibacteria group bacterium]
MLPKGPYNPIDHEDEIYQAWEQGGFFKPAENAQEKFSIVMPPPNVTGVLHMGHALMVAVEDLMVRYNRMLGKSTLWLPGTDHAAIATQSKVEKILYKQEGKSRHDFGREEFLKKVEEFAQNSHDTIVSQAKRLGCSCDWSREAFTLDETRTKAVYTAFKKMYEDGLIYQGDKVVNWDPKGQTVISDDEVVHKERDTQFYTFKYAKDFPISISTTRPETKLGDTAVAVHPDDERYKKYVGQEFDCNFCGVLIHIKIIADEEVDPEFGTGALGVTPAHSIIDWEIAERHNLPSKQVIDECAKIMVGGDNLKNKKVEQARQVVVEWLKKEGLLEKEETIKQNVSTAERTGALIEPLPKKQWFIDVNKKFVLENSNLKDIKAGQETSLKELMRSVVESGEIKILPDHFKKTYFHWIDNLRDWCISRQIWYGHRIPVYYRKLEKPKTKNQKPKINKNIYIGEKAPEGDNWEQDPDTLDTWFSSGLWTFSTLGWSAKTDDLKNFHPTDVMETGYDILFFWVARMILMTTYLLGDIPFKTVYLHGLIRDEDKKKMSKSSGNAVDPLGVMQEFGTDALRMALVFSTGQGRDVVITKDKILAQKKFANKIWNASKFVLMHLEDSSLAEVSSPRHADDKSILKKLDNTVKQVTKDIDNFMFHESAQSIYQFFWSDFCDLYLESVKFRLSSDNLEDKKTVQNILYYILSTSLKLLHPFMPFITERIWAELPKENPEMLIIQKWPE